MGSNELISSLQKAYEDNKMNTDGSAYKNMLEREYLKALKGKFDTDKIYSTKDGRYKVRTPIQVCRKEKIDVLKAVYEYFYGAEETPTIEEMYNKWIAEFEVITQEGHRSWDTLDRYKSDWKKFFAGSALVKMRITEVKMSDLKNHYQKITANEAITRKALSNIKTLLNQVFDAAMDADIIKVNLARSVNTKKLKCKENDNTEQVYSEDERIAVMNEAMKLDNSYGRAIVVTFCLCARIGEIRALKWSDVDFDKHTIYIHSSMRRTRNEQGKQVAVWTNTTKGRLKSGQRVEPLSDTAYKVLKIQRQINPFSEYIFMDNGHALDTTQFNRWLKRICEAIDVKYLSSQKIRFTSVTMMIDSGVTLGMAQKIAGHARPSTTEGYIRNKKSAAVGLETWNGIFN